MKHTLKNIEKSWLYLLFAGSLCFTSCTSQFEKWNINPNEVTPDQMEQDNLNTGAYFRDSREIGLKL